MEEQVFFSINGDELILDKVLVEYNEAPIFFVCKHDEKYFVASCVDLEEEEYIVTGVSLNSLSKMLHGKIAMRELILQADMFWDITVGEDVADDCVIPKSMDVIPLDALPYENAYLEIATKDLEKYVEEIDAILYGEGVWESKPVQEYVEYIESFLKDFNEQYENVFQGIYECMIETVNRSIESISSEIDSVNKVYSSEIQIEVENAEMNRAFVSDGKYAFAA